MGSSKSRFQPTRAGIINLWDYTDQEFSFADGRLVLRGPNGSGKTKALEVLFPFVLDGRIEPRRLNPFAGEERTMKSNLLYRGQDSAHSYVWMEFLRGDHANPEAVTVGIGMRASRQVDKVTRWYFVAEGRVGTDFSLLGADDRPLTKRQLIDELGADAITDRPIDYRHAIDARLFGLGPQRYDQLINLILTLRRPQLAKNLDPKGLSQALTDGLRPLDEQLVLEAARSFSDMEEVGKALEGLARADDAARNFVAVYSKYVRVQVRSDVEQVTRRMEAVTHAVTALYASAALRARRHDERAAAEKRFDEAERSLDKAMAYRETLRGSSAYENKRQLDDLAESAAKFRLSTRQQSERAQKSQAELEARIAENSRAAVALADSAVARERSEDDLQLAAEDAGIAWSSLPPGSRTDQFLNAVRGYVEERDADVRATRAALVTLDWASSERDRAGSAAEESKSRLDGATRAVSEAELATELARADCIDNVRTWWSTNSALYESIAVDPTLLERLIDGIGNAGDPDAPTLAAILGDETQAQTAALRSRRERAEIHAAAITSSIAVLTEDRARVASETDDAPPESAARTLSRSTMSGAPLWRLVRFSHDVPADVAAGIESALQAANILDGWVLGSDAGSAIPTDVASDIFLEPTSTTPTSIGRTLADVLEIEPDTEVPRERVARILSSIAVTGAGASDETVPNGSRSPAVSVGVNGAFWQGVQRGHSSKPVAEFIGATARARRRAARLVEIDAALEDSRSDHAEAEAESAHATQLLTQHSAAARMLPKTGAIVNARRAVAEAAGALRMRSESSAAADRELDRAIAELSVCEKQLRTAAVTHRTPHRSRELDTLAASIRHFEAQSAAVLRKRSEHVREAERASEASARMDEAQGLAEELAEEAAISEENYQQQVSRLETLSEKLGAGADRIGADLEVARQAIEQCKSEQRAARKADKEAGEAIGTAEGTYNAAAESVRNAVTECRTDAGRLAPYAQADLLDLLGIDNRYSWPATDAAWLGTEQIFYRIASADGPESDVPVVPDVVSRLHRELVDATASVRLSDNARKSSRTALTTALQEFDAKLAASGHDYRLHWDAPDGLTVVRVQDDRGHSSIGEFSVRIAASRADQELLLTESERRILEDALLTGLAQQIHERTVDARDLIAQMAGEMKQRRMSSGNTIGVHWVLTDSLDEGARAISKLVDRDASAMTADDLAAMRAHFASEIRIARSTHPERSYPEILSSTLDYRAWRVFSFTLIGVDGSEDRLTVARHSALSGGEQSVSLHLPLFAAAHVMLSSADPHSPRLLALDEAFAGVDDNGRSELLGLSVQFDLDLFMTGYDLWITYADVPACAHYDLAHSAAENTVSAVLLVWENGELFAEHSGGDLASALGSPRRSRVPTSIEGGLEFSTQGN